MIDSDLRCRLAEIGLDRGEVAALVLIHRRCGATFRNRLSEVRAHFGRGGVELAGMRL